MWRALFIFLVTWALLRPGVSLAAEHPVIVGPGAAFVVGNGSYPGMNSLGTVPEEDVKAVSGALKGLKYKVDNQTDAWTATEFIAELATFAEKAQDDRQRLLFFYYAGHAVVIGGRIWLLPSEGALPHPAANQTLEQWASQNLVDMNGVVDTLQKTGATAIVIVLDACRTLKDDPRDWFLPPGEARGSEARTWNLPPIAPPRAAATIVTAYSTMNDNKAANDGKYAKALATAISGGENVTTSRLFKDTATIFAKNGARGQTPTASEIGLSDICLAGTVKGCMEKGSEPPAELLWQDGEHLLIGGYSFGGGGLIVQGGGSAYVDDYGGSAVPIDDFGVAVVTGEFDLKKITQSVGPFRGLLGFATQATVGYTSSPPSHFVFGGGMLRPADAGGGWWFSKPSFGLMIGGTVSLGYANLIVQAADGGPFVDNNAVRVSLRGLIVFESRDGLDLTLRALDATLLALKVTGFPKEAWPGHGWALVTPIDIDLRLPLHPGEPKGWKLVGRYEYRNAVGEGVPAPYSYQAFSLGFGKRL